MAPRKKAKSNEGLFKCLHCDDVYDFPANYCVVCNMHMHTLFMGSNVSVEVNGKKLVKPDNVCYHCFKGRNKWGLAWRRSLGKWVPPLDFSPAAWDDPEWYDGMEEWKNTTIMEVWNPNVLDIEEL